jgi:hypothetical protein
LPWCGEDGTVNPVVDDERDGVRLTSLDQPLGDGLGVT